MQKKVSARMLKEVLRLHYEAKLSNRRISRAVRLSKTTVKHILGRFATAGLTWPLSPDLTESTLTEQLYPTPEIAEGRPLPDWEQVHQELSRPHVTLKLLWQEYKQTYPDGVGLSQFCARYSRYKVQHLEPTMHQEHKGGDKLFVDYSGDTLSYVERSTGEVVPVELFVACWGASSFTYAEGTLSQTLFDWTQSHIRAFRYFGCVPHLLVPDNLKSGVTTVDWYDPERNPLYAKLAEHYQTAILPARPRKPRDKAPVESAVGYAQRFILARLRDRTFYSLAEVNEAVRALVEELNDTLMQQFRVSRRQRFEQLDKPYAQPLPEQDFPYVALKLGVLVNRDYHLEYQKHFYSVPHTLCGQRVDIRQTNSVVEVYHEGLRIASHLISYKHYGYTTTPEHMPANHRFVRGWSPGYFLNRATKIGPSMVEVVKIILKRSSHPEVGFRSALGVLSLERRYPLERLERAAVRALHCHQINRKSIRSILDQGLDRQPLPTAREPQQTTLFHENIRGASYYTQSQEVQC